MLIEFIVPGIILFTVIIGLIYLIKTSAKEDKETSEKVIHKFIDTGDFFDICKDIARVCYDPKTKIVYLLSRGQITSYLSILYDELGYPMTIYDYKNIYKKEGENHQR